MKKFKSNLKKYREKTQLNQPALASSIGASSSCISNYETGLRRPSLTSAQSIRNVLVKNGVSCDIDDLFPLPENKAA
jgi:putative transcriptional regulator